MRGRCGDADLTTVANAIRAKGGTSAALAFPNGFASAVNAIPGGGTVVVALKNELAISDSLIVEIAKV